MISAAVVDGGGKERGRHGFAAATFGPALASSSLARLTRSHRW